MKMRCKKCLIEKSTDEFYKKRMPNHSYDACKVCVRERVKNRYHTYGKEQVKRYEYLRVRDPVRKAKHKIHNATWKAKNIERVKLQRKAYKTKIKMLGIHEFSPEGKKRIKELVLIRHNQRYKEDINYKLAVSLRTRTNIAIRGHQKSGSAVADLGCSIKELKTYLEQKFTPGMSWDNWGKWHIDHIMPLSRVDLSDRTQYLKVVHYTNLQPLWAHDNLTKNNKIPDKFQL